MLIAIAVVGLLEKVRNNRINSKCCKVLGLLEAVKKTFEVVLKKKVPK